MDTGLALLVGGGLLVVLQGLQTLQMWMAGRRIERTVARVAQSLQPPPPLLPRSLAELERQVAELECRLVEFERRRRVPPPPP